MIMPLTAVTLTAVSTGSGAVLLTSWMRTRAQTDSAWLRSGLHTLLAVLGGAGAAALARNWAELVAFATLALACALLVVIDLASLRLPNLILGPLYPILFVALTVAAAVGDDWARLAHAAIAAVALTASYLVLALISPSNLGLGDVKLAGILGAFLGWLGWPSTLLGTTAAFILSGICALILLLSSNATRHTAFPFGPMMVSGAAIGAAFGSTLLTGSG
jgi:leader peptidase (prepilin peptidase)/N-methyltransferase